MTVRRGKGRRLRPNWPALWLLNRASVNGRILDRLLGGFAYTQLSLRDLAGKGVRQRIHELRALGVPIKTERTHSMRYSWYLIRPDFINEYSERVRPVAWNVKV